MTPSKQQSRWSLLLLLGAATLLLLTACGPVFERNRYISLEDYPDARVVKRERIKPSEDFHISGQVAKRYFTGEVASIYRIRRDGYTLHFELPRGAFGEVIYVLVTSYPNAQIKVVEHSPAPQCRFEDWVPQQDKWGSWEYRHRSAGDCQGKHVDKHMRFQVIAADGTVLGEEAIPYTIKTSGFSVYIDAI